MFNKGGLFYSRRIGSEGQLFNATKFSGRTASSTGIGVFQAFARDTTDGANALTSYNVTVVDQNLPNNGYITAAQHRHGPDRATVATRMCKAPNGLAQQSQQLVPDGNAARNTMAQGDIDLPR